MFTYPKVQIPARPSVGLEIAGGREGQSCLGRRRQIRGTSDHPGKVRRDGVEDFGGRIASGDSLMIGRKDGNIFRPVRRQLSPLNLIDLRREFGELFSILRKLFFPLLTRFAAPPPNSGLEVVIHSVGNQKLGVSRPAIGLLYELDLFFAERLAVRSARILTMRRTIADMTIDDYDGRSARRARSSPQRVLDAIQIVGIPYAKDVPSVRQKASCHIFGERNIGFALDGDVIVVVDPAEVIELQVPRKRSCLARDAFHHAAVAAERVNAIAEQFKIWLVVT